MRTIGLVFFTLKISMLSLPALANWQLNNEHSTIDFISIKNEHISESHTFTALSGRIDNTGNVAVSVDLKSVDTMIEIRNERMQEHLFNVHQTPNATLSAQLPEDVMKMEKGTTKMVNVPSQISLNGKTQSYALVLQVSHNIDGSFAASTAKPFLINAMTHDLVPGVKKLKELAGLSSITLTVPVTFSVVFEQL